MAQTKRIRDPVHGLIVFESKGSEAARDQIAWRLLNTPEMQRLRRIRQLGVSEFTFPGATHTRFAHSLGVFHVARQLSGVLKKLLPDDEWRSDRAEVATYAALLHDVGHGPFSHAFERVQSSRGAKKHHEEWTAEIILDPDGHIRPILESRRRGMAQEIADLLRAEVPEDAYHAIVSSSFDADRLDYLRRDRLMTGSGAGAIDFDWLIDNLDVAAIPIGADDDESIEGVKTFCLRAKALQAAEAFLLARYQLFEQVYLHKTTRGMETIVGLLLARIAKIVLSGNHNAIGLDSGDPLVRFYQLGIEGSIEAYLNLDDTAVWAAAKRVSESSDEEGRTLARRLIERQRMPCLDIQSMFPRREGESFDEAERRWNGLIDRVDNAVKGDLSVVKDVVKNSAYGEIGGDSARVHKRLTIRLDGGPPREISAISEIVRAIPRSQVVRYFFASESARNSVQEEILK